VTDRKKKGIGFLITSVLFAVAGIVFYALPVTPTWVPTVFGIVGIVASALGFVIVFPDTKD
jgi:uncharacterized membrane protein HdeD (DUF308 family)